MSERLDLAPLASDERAAWPAVVSLAFGVFELVTTELLPASLLTPTTSGLSISEALTGQAVSTTAIVALSPNC